MATILLWLDNEQSSIGKWEKILPQAMSTKRGLLSTGTYKTPHSRPFSFLRFKPSKSLPDWMIPSSTALLKLFYTIAKYGTKVESMKLIDVNKDYLAILNDSGSIWKVSNQYVAPFGTNRQTDGIR
ncbi:hypothetical protein GJ496_010938 [Pomphorhynchus laevis]|nr:hypothetical protein GJ496_010938 [Pomphorhynchus laevis]